MAADKLLQIESVWCLTRTGFFQQEELAYGHPKMVEFISKAQIALNEFIRRNPTRVQIDEEGKFEMYPLQLTGDLDDANFRKYCELERQKRFADKVVDFYVHELPAGLIRTVGLLVVYRGSAPDKPRDVSLEEMAEAEMREQAQAARKRSPTEKKLPAQRVSQPSGRKGSPSGAATAKKWWQFWK